MGIKLFHYYLLIFDLHNFFCRGRGGIYLKHRFENIFVEDTQAKPEQRGQGPSIK